MCLEPVAVQWNLVNPDVDDPETSPFGHNLTGTESPNANTHIIHLQCVRINEVPLYFTIVLGRTTGSNNVELIFLVVALTNTILGLDDGLRRQGHLFLAVGS